jgi:S1-C subfamily serine protease
MGKSIVASVWVLVGGSALVSSCGGARPAPVTTPVASSSASQAARAEPPARFAPKLCSGRKLIGALLDKTADGESEEAAKDKPKDADKEASKAAAPAPVAAQPAADFQKAYRSVAPSTVVVKTKTGHGTGVIVDPAGIVLTNFHVVSTGMQKDFTFKVSVSFGKIGGSGVMQLEDKTYEALMIRADRTRDLALLRVTDPPKGLVAAPLSKADPQPGQAVSSIGHAGVGMLWAMKTCHVSALGELANRSMLAAKDCSEAGQAAKDDDTPSDPAERREAKKQCEQTKERMKRAMTQVEALFVQTDCRVGRGDSGGPLIDGQGLIVGLNQSVSADVMTATGTSYHVHVTELRSFVAQPPAEPAQLPPDPWCDAGTETALEDVDFDGKPDAIRAYSFEPSGLFGGNQRYAIFMDLDEDSTTHDHAAEVAAGETEMPFDAEVALLSLPKGTYVWYDTNNDGRFDLLLSDPEDKGRPTAAFDIARDGKLSEKTGFLAPHFFDVRLLGSNEVMHEHLGKIAQMFDKKYSSGETLADGKARVVVPDPRSTVGRKGRTMDNDRNGKSDAVSFNTAFSRGVLFDLDEDSLGGVKPNTDAEAALKSGAIDAELTYVSLPSGNWFVYDTDNDGKHDLAIVAPRASSDGIAGAAYVRKGSDWSEVSDEYAGLRALRPQLFKLPRARAMIGSQMSRVMASDDGLGLLPALKPPAARYDFAYKPVKPGAAKPAVKEPDKGAKKAEPKREQEKAVVVSMRFPYVFRYFDADRDSKIGKDATATDLMRDDGFHADVVTFGEGQSAWAVYDTDGDKKLDLVLYSRNLEEGTSDLAYRLEGDRLRPDPKVAKGKLYRFKGIFKSARVADGFKALAKDYLPSKAREE